MKRLTGGRSLDVYWIGVDASRPGGLVGKEVGGHTANTSVIFAFSSSISFSFDDTRPE